MKNNIKSKFCDIFRDYLADESSASLESLTITLILRIVELDLEKMDLEFQIFEVRKLRNKDIVKLNKVR